MKPSLQPGMDATTTFVVTAAMAPGHLSMVVLSTPDMIRQIEGVCAGLAAPHLDENETTVGTHVCVSHVGAAFEHETVTVRVNVKSIDGRRITFDTEVLSPRGSVSTGTHERAVIRTDRFKT
jgi:fluoroacetyl-CoA thioesterase